MRMKETLARLAALGAALGLSACALIYDLSGYDTTGGGAGADAATGSGPGSGSGESSSAGSGPDAPIPSGSFQLGGAGRDTVAGMDVDGAGNVFVLSVLAGPFMFDDQPYSIKEDEVGLVLFKLDPSGQVLWNKLIAASTTAEDLPADLAVTKDGLAAITGGYQKWADVGHGQTPNFGQSNGFVAVLDPAGGFLWGKTFGQLNRHAGSGVAIDPSGRVAITGFFRGEAVNFGDVLDMKCLVANPNLGTNPFVATFDPTGKCVWARTVQGTGDAFGDKVAIDSTGSVIFTGHLTGEITLDQAGSLSKGPSALDDGFVVKLNTDNTVAFGRIVGPEARARVTIDPDDTILLSGTVRGPLYFDSTHAVYGGADMMAASIASSGDSNWAHAYGGPGDDALALAVDPAGGFVVAGSIREAISWGGGMLKSIGGADAFVGALDSAGNPNGGTARFGDGGDQGIAFIRLDAQKNRIVAGQFQGSLDFGKGPLTSRGDFDIFVTKIAPLTP